MLSLSPTVKVEIGFIDRDGNVREMGYHLPSSTPIDAAYSSATAIASAAQGISNAALHHINIRYAARNTPTPEPEITSDSRSHLVLFYSNGEDTEPITIPSPNPLWLEQSGRFAGIRLDLANPQVVSLADALTTALLATVGPDASEWGRSLVTGGRTL